MSLVQPLTGYFVAVLTGKTRKQHRIGCSLHIRCLDKVIFIDRVAGFAVLAIMMLSVLLTLGYLTVQEARSVYFLHGKT